MKLDDNILISRVDHYDFFLKGKEYYRLGKVKEIMKTPSGSYYVGSVYGSSIYRTTVRFAQNGDIQDTSCTCDDYKTYTGDCKHVIALLISIREHNRTGKLTYKKTEGDIKNIIKYYRESQVDNRVDLNLEVNYEFSNGESYINLRIGEERLYVVRNMASFLSDLINEKILEFGKQFTYYPDIHKFGDKDDELINFLMMLYENYEINQNYGRSVDSTFVDKRVKLSPKSLESFFKLMANSKINAEIKGKLFKDVWITDDKIELKFKIDESGEDLILSMDEDEFFEIISSDGKYVFYKDRIHKLPREQADAIMPLFNEIADKDIKSLRINKNLKETFISSILPRIKKYSQLNIDENVKDSIYNPPFNASIYFDRDDHLIFGRLLFSYGEIEINPFSSELAKKDPNRILLRDVENENIILGLLEQGDFKVEDGRIFLEEEELIFDFINDIIPKLQEYCEIYYSNSFKNMRIIDSESFTGEIQLRSDLNLLEFSFDIEGIDTSQLGDIFAAIKETKKYYKLKDGSFLSLDSEEFKDILDIIDYLGVEGKELEKGSIIIPKYNSMYLDKFIDDRKLNYIKKNSGFKKLVRDINEPEDISYEIPKSLNAELRDYQKFGFKWLKTLSKYGLGGILADDMGLGKTIQILTFLLSQKEEKGPETSIVIVPTSLVYNWEEEVKKFAPDLKTLIVIGSKEERDGLIDQAKDYDLLITSYPLVRNDIDKYESINFSYCILDEAQHIKNHRSLNAKSAKKIKAKNYFALTGTPMENSLSELWSIFDFLMPGYLLNHREFTQKYEKPISRDQDKEKLKDLNYHIKPFILRRLKKEVLKELPDKIEQKIVVEMTKEQKELYLAYLKAIKGELEDEISKSGYNRNHIRILAGLTRLRQLCCHPGLFIEDYQGDSGKLQSLEEIVVDAVEGNHRILIFSQFTSMLKKIKEVLDRNTIEYLYLDGATPSIERGELVKEFNRGIGDVFLISLRAGGTGLNLTSADMVIHYDPWWNPAVEDQATDRAHRIGQEDTVQVIKLITKGTIEEKIFQLQEKKKEMIDKVITEGETLISKLSEEEIMSLFEA